MIDASYRGEKVVVQALNEAAGPDEQRRFLQQALKQRTMGEHVNVVSLLGVALDSPPFLSVLKSGDDDAGDLKTFLLNAGGKLIFNGTSNNGLAVLSLKIPFLQSNCPLTRLWCLDFPAISLRAWAICMTCFIFLLIWAHALAV